MEVRQHNHRPIKRNHSNASPRYIIAFDVETIEQPVGTKGTQFSHQFKLATAIYGRLRDTEISDIKRVRFNTKDDFFVWLASLTASNYTTWVVSHNVLFDFITSGLDVQFERGELTIEWPRGKRVIETNQDDDVFCHSLAVIESPPTIIACKVGITQGRMVLIDTLNWFPTALADLGKACGLPKLAMPDVNSPIEDWFVYCERDTEIVFRVFTELIKWTKDNDFGMFRYTAPSQAMSAYRHRYMPRKIFCHDNKDVRTMERAGCYGGRTEVFKIGKINEIVHQLDINALFPSVMATEHYPFVLDRYDIAMEYTSQLPKLEWYNVMAEVELDCKQPLYPVRKDNIVIYPIGKFKTILCGHELLRAYKNGEITAIKSWAEYRTADLFSLWVSELWDMRTKYRTQGNELYREFVKRLMNSLYGKFGQRQPKWINIRHKKNFLPWSTWIDDSPEDGKPTLFRSFGWQAQYQTGRAEIEGTFIAIPAFVTAAARVRMDALRDIAGHENVYYQGVDGLIVTTVGRERLEQACQVADLDLGKLRLELTVNNGEIIGCADYRLGDKVIVAGRSKIYNQADQARNMQYKFAASAYLFSGKATSCISAELVPWTRQQSYRKGIVNDNGWVNPYQLHGD